MANQKFDQTFLTFMVQLFDWAKIGLTKLISLIKTVKDCALSLFSKIQVCNVSRHHCRYEVNTIYHCLFHCVPLTCYLSKLASAVPIATFAQVYLSPGDSTNKSNIDIKAYAEILSHFNYRYVRSYVIKIRSTGYPTGIDW